jgi:sterol 24-C-methyltransferase
LVRVLETLRLAPKGATEISTVLNIAADSLVAGGQAGIFTPMFFYLAKKK